MTGSEPTLRVECYAGHRGEETPRRFALGNRKVEVVRVLDRWLAPEHRYFKLLSAEGGVYILRHDVERDGWELTLYEEPAASGPRAGAPAPRPVPAAEEEREEEEEPAVT